MSMKKRSNKRLKRKIKPKKTSYESLLESMERGIPNNSKNYHKKLMWKGESEKGRFSTRSLTKKE